MDRLKTSSDRAATYLVVDARAKAHAAADRRLFQRNALLRRLAKSILSIDFDRQREDLTLALVRRIADSCREDLAQVDREAGL